MSSTSYDTGNGGDSVDRGDFGVFKDFLRRYFVPEFHPDHEEAFAEHCDEIGRYFYVWLSNFAFWAVLLTWPVDYYIYAGRPELLYYINVWRITTVLLAAGLLVGHYGLGLTEDYWSELILVGFLGATFSIYYSLSQTGGLSQPWFYSAYCLPFLATAFIHFGLGHRIVITAGLPSVAVVSYFGSNPQHLEYSYVGTPLTLVVVFSVGGIVIGQIFHNLFKRSFVQSRKLEDSLSQKQALLEEVHHRVKNNLQTISSMLKMQVNEQQSEEARGILRDSMDRIRSMAYIHEQLYQSDDISNIEFSNYVRELCEHQARIHARGNVTFDLDVDDVEVDLDQAINCGMLINELVSNAIEHGFDQEDDGTVSVAFRVRDTGGVSLEVADDGKGVGRLEKLEEGSTTGIAIVRTLVEYGLDGRLSFENDEGLTVRATFQL